MRHQIRGILIKNRNLNLLQTCWMNSKDFVSSIELLSFQSKHANYISPNGISSVSIQETKETWIKYISRTLSILPDLSLSDINRILLSLSRANVTNDRLLREISQYLRMELFKDSKCIYSANDVALLVKILCRHKITDCELFVSVSQQIDKKLDSMRGSDLALIIFAYSKACGFFENQENVLFFRGMKREAKENDLAFSFLIPTSLFQKLLLHASKRLYECSPNDFIKLFLSMAFLDLQLKNATCHLFCLKSVFYIKRNKTKMTAKQLFYCIFGLTKIFQKVTECSDLKHYYAKFISLVLEKKTDIKQPDQNLDEKDENEPLLFCLVSDIANVVFELSPTDISKLIILALHFNFWTFDSFEYISHHLLRRLHSLSLDNLKVLLDFLFIRVKEIMQLCNINSPLLINKDNANFIQTLKLRKQKKDFCNTSTEIIPANNNNNNININHDLTNNLLSFHFPFQDAHSYNQELLQLNRLILEIKNEISQKSE